MRHLSEIGFAAEATWYAAEFKRWDTQSPHYDTLHRVANFAAYQLRQQLNHGDEYITTAHPADSRERARKLTVCALACAEIRNLSRIVFDAKYSRDDEINVTR